MYAGEKQIKSFLCIFISMLDVLGAITKISDALPLQPRSQQVDTIKRTVTVCDERLVLHALFYFAWQ
jgi:hypothetical protein